LSRTLYRVLVIFPGLFTHYKYRSRDLPYAGKLHKSYLECLSFTIPTDNTNRNIRLCYIGSLKKVSSQFIIPGINNFLVKVRASVHFQIPCQHLEIFLIVVIHSWKRDHNKFKLNKVMQDKNKNNFFIITRKSPSSTCKADILVIWIRAADFFERVHFTRHL
jgi:hypothetical protein